MRLSCRSMARTLSCTCSDPSEASVSSYAPSEVFELRLALAVELAAAPDRVLAPLAVRRVSRQSRWADR